MKKFEQSLIEAEEQIDDSCAEFIVIKDRLETGKVHFTGKNIYVDKKHVLSVMERHTTKEQQVIALATFAKVYDLPIKELFQLKHYYRVRTWKLTLRLWFTYIVFLIVSIALGLLWFYEFIQVSSAF
jgi:hypothetical protein